MGPYAEDDYNLTLCPLQSRLLHINHGQPHARAGIFKKSMGARHRGGIGFPYRPARLHRLAELIP
jgi:hypothetical protein